MGVTWPTWRAENVNDDGRSFHLLAASSCCKKWTTHCPDRTIVLNSSNRAKQHTELNSTPLWYSHTTSVHSACLILLTGHWPLFDMVKHRLYNGLPSDLQRQSPEHLIPFDTACHSGCNCHLLKAFKTIKSSSVVGAWQYISALIRTLGWQRNCPPRANPAPRGAAPTKLIIVCGRTSWNTATAAVKYRFYNGIPISDLLSFYSNFFLSCHNDLSPERHSLFLYLIEFVRLKCVAFKMELHDVMQHLSALKSWPSLGQQIYQGAFPFVFCSLRK